MSETKQTIMLGFHSQLDSRLMREWLISLAYKVVESLENRAGIDLVLMDSVTARSFMDKAFGLKREAKYFLPTLVCVNAGEDVGRWLKAGFDDALRLPVSKAEWQARIDIMLRLRSQSEELGRKSEMLHQALVESSSDHIFLLDTNGTYVTSNDQVDHLGLERGDEVVGKTLDQVYPHEVAPFYRTQLLRVLTEGKTVVFEHDLPSGQDTYHHLDTLYPVNLPDGTLMVGGICRDITERNKAKEALKEAQSNLQALLDNWKDSIWSLDRNYNYLVFNKPYADVIFDNMGIRIEKGMNALEIHPKEVNDFWKPKFDEVFKGKYVTFEFSHVLEGKEHFFEVLMNPIYTDNKVSGLSALSMDITQRKQAEQALKESEKHAREIFDYSSVPILEEDFSEVKQAFEKLKKSGVSDIKKFFEKNPDQVKRLASLVKIIDINETSLEFYNVKNRKEFVKELSHWFNDTSWEVFEKELVSLAHGETKFESEIPVVTPKGVLKYLHLKLTVPPGFENTLNRVLVSFFDITEIKNAEREIKSLNESLEKRIQDRTAQLEASNKELEAFSYSVSHDLRAPLRAINGFTRFLMEDYVNQLDDEGKRLGDVIQKSALKMGNLIDDLLAFSKLGRASMQFSNIDMKNLVNAIYHEATEPSERTRIKFSVADLPDAYGDTNMMRQVWMNLISNAIKFSSRREKALISITCTQDDENVTYRITDNGAGFDMQYVNKIFDVFQRLHGENEYPGTGVGLSLVQRIVNRHNGKIWAESELDKGATFYFSLPKKGINETSKH